MGERQRLEKELRLAQQATIERMEFEKNVNAFRAQQHEIEKQQQEHHAKKEQYSEKLRGAERETTQDKRIEIEREEAQLVEIKKQKLAEMQKYGVPAKYMADLVRFKVDRQ